MGDARENLILGVDPGTTKTAYAVYDKTTKAIVLAGMLDNGTLLLQLNKLLPEHEMPRHMAIEMMAGMGMTIGQSVLETAVWIGRFIQEWISVHDHTHELVYRIDEKLHLCGVSRAKDANIRQAIMDRYGSTRQTAIGTAKHKGPLYGVSKDMWSAIAVAIVATEVPASCRRAKGGTTL